jgi:RNA polymerase sigma factor (sigma-70 family)
MEAVMDEPTSEEATGPTGPIRPAPGVDVTVLYGRQRQSMVRLARILTGSFEVAEELVQEAFLKLHLSPTVAQHPDSYLRTIVTNLAWGHLRRLRLERALRPQDRIVVPAPDIDETWEVVCRLPFRQRAVLALRYYEDLSEPEIAQILGCRLGTVKSSHHRALATLKRQLS